MLEPRISKRGNKLHLSYELNHRIHCSRIYPLPGANGSSVVLYGHDTGIQVLWRGGRRPKERSANNEGRPKSNGTGKSQDVAMIDGEENEAGPPTGLVDDEYEAEDEAQDPECPYPDVVAELHLDLETEVLNLAIPSLAGLQPSQLPEVARNHMIAALACADGTVKLITIPLGPPAPGTHADYAESYVDVVDLQGTKSVSRELTMKVIPKSDYALNEEDHSQAVDSAIDGRLLVASISSALDLWNLPFTDESFAQSPESLVPAMHSLVSGSSVAFQSSPRQSNLLTSESSGVVRVFSLFTGARPSSQDSASSRRSSSSDPGSFVMSYQTPFHVPENGTPLARRKKILSATWVLSGRGILVLLEDGQWGIWDTSSNSQNSGKSLQDFALQGYLTTSTTTADTASAAPQKKANPKLAPMTPNTRKSKANSLFSGPTKPAFAAPSGGTSVTSTTTRSGYLDESVMIWYNNSIYSIPSMQTFWQRSTNAQNSGDKNSFGGLYAPGLTHINEIDLMHENVTSISQFVAKPVITTNPLGQMNTQKDLLVSGEHRYVVLQHIRPHTPKKEQVAFAHERPVSRDQKMLDAGESDLGGLNRIMDGMTGEERVRRVGFAA